LGSKPQNAFCQRFVKNALSDVWFFDSFYRLYFLAQLFGEVLSQSATQTAPDSMAELEKVVSN